MSFKDEIIKLESEDVASVYTFKEGSIPVILTAPHTMRQVRSDGTVKASEPYTKAIAMYVANRINAYYLIKNIDTGIDANSNELEHFKEELVKIINANDIKLVLDIHGAKESREFDIELGTLNNLSADFSTIRELKEAFVENGVTIVDIDTLFKGGGITKNVYFSTDVDVIQIEINKKFRDIESALNIQKICDALIKFIKQYTSK